MFNNYTWKIYLDSGGNKVVQMFEQNLKEEYNSEYADRIKEFRMAYCPSSFIANNEHEQLLDLLEETSMLVEGEYTVESAMTFLRNDINEYNNNQLTASQIFEVFIQNMSFYTTYLCIALPNLFIPYYFQYNFNVLQKIAEEFEIDLPEMPTKKDYEKRLFYYSELCEVLTDFRSKNNLSPYEFCAFLYDFAPKYIGGLESYIIKDLPESKSGYFIGGSKDDAFFSYNDDVLPWQCNPQTRAGDMIVMYLRTPISAVDSFWRSVSVGFNDPFFYYYRMTYIGNPILATRVTQKQMKEDKILGQLPIVKKNMQGINGVELEPSAYNHLVTLSKAKALKLEYVLENNDAEFVCEKDVENKLIKKLIEKLGYCENDYTQQMHIKIGNHNGKLIPDFVLLPLVKRGHHSAFAIIEAKLKISDQKNFEEVKTQARSYAKQLGVKYSIIASKDKIWISKPNDDFDEDIFTATWNELNNADKFSELNKMLGKK